MADSATAAASTKKVKTTATKKPADHPPVAAMVEAAVKALKDRKGSSLAAIKKYIAANYKVDVARISIYIRGALKKAVATGKLVQVKGTGAAGSFKMGQEEKPKKATKPKTTKPTTKKSPKKTTNKVSSKTKTSPKEVTKAKKETPKKAAEAKKETPKKAKKTKTPKKSVTKKPNAAKKPAAKKTPKKAAKKPTAKKTAAKK